MTIVMGPSGEIVTPDGPRSPTNDPLEDIRNSRGPKKISTSQFLSTESDITEEDVFEMSSDIEDSQLSAVGDELLVKIMTKAKDMTKDIGLQFRFVIRIFFFEAFRVFQQTKSTF